MWLSRSLRVFGAGFASIAVLVGTGVTQGVASDKVEGWTITPVLSGLNSPRGLAFDGKGNLYVSESGQYRDIAPGNFGVTRTGKVDKYVLAHGGPRLVWSTPFDSLYDSTNGGPEVLGPEGISALGNGCTKDSRGRGEACQVLMIESESKAGVLKTTPGLTIPQIGHLFRLNGATGAATAVTDVGAQQYLWTGQHPDLFPPDFPDSNPYGVLVTRDPKTDRIRTFVADAGANTVSEVMRDGTVRVIAYIPNDPIRDSSPTCIAQGPDGNLYVGTLDFVANLFVLGPGQSHVYRINPNTHEGYLTAAHLWASGLTTITSCAFDRAGNYWATEMFQPNVGGPPGDLVRIPFNHPTAVEHVGGGSLPLPGGVAQGRDGGLYVSVNSANTDLNSGGVVRVAAID
jgi:hypothetical protein